MPRSLDHFIRDLREDLRDTSGSNNTYTRAEIGRALRRAQEEAARSFFIQSVHESISTGVNQHDYAIPRHLQRIFRVEKEILPFPTVSNSGPAEWMELRSWQHIPDQQTNRLWLEHNWPDGERLRIHYERDLPVFPVEATLTTGITATARVVPYLTSSPDYPIADWPIPGYAQIVPGGDIFYYDAVTATAFTNVLRGMFGTGVQTATIPFGLSVASPSLISPVWVQDQHPAENFFVARAMETLLKQRLLDGDSEGNKVIAQLATDWEKRADRAKGGRQRHLPRTLQVRRQMR